MGLQQRRHQRAVAPAHIHYRRDPREVICRKNRSCLLGGVSAHGRLELRLGRRVVAQVVVQRLTVDVLERRPAGLNAVEHVAIGLPKPLLAIQDRQATQRSSQVCLQHLGQPGSA